MLAVIGLILIIAGWALQLAHSKKKEIRREFIALYCMGAVLLVTDGFLNGLVAIALLNLVVLAIAGLVALKTKK